MLWRFGEFLFSVLWGEWQFLFYDGKLGFDICLLYDEILPLLPLFPCRISQSGLRHFCPRGIQSRWAKHFSSVDRNSKHMEAFQLSCAVLKATDPSGKSRFAAFRGLHSAKQPALHQRISHSSAVAFEKSPSFPKISCVGGSGTLKSTGESDDPVISIPNLFSTNGVRIAGLERGLLPLTEFHRDSIALRKPAPKITPKRDQVFVSGVDEDQDCPSEGFCSIPEAIEAIRHGKFVIVVDDEDRENEGDLIMAASLATTEAMAFIVKHGSGIVCVGMKEEDLERLRLPLMVPDKENEEKLLTAFTVSVDAKLGTTTGVSASDRANTILALASPHSNHGDFKRPGHVFPLKYREGGVLKRPGHTEASVDLATLAGLSPVAVLCEIVDDDGSMARLPRLREFAKEHNLPIISIADLVRYRRKREILVQRTAIARLPTKWGDFKAYSYRSKLDGLEHVAMVKGEIGDGQDVLVRVHSECLTGDIFGSTRCDCGNQLALAMQQIDHAGKGVLVYLRGHEGRGIGLGYKLQAYNLQDQGRDTVEANVELGLPIDSREYGIGAQMLRDIGVRSIRLMTNNPAKFIGLKGYGLKVTGRVPVLSPVTPENKRYLETKRVRMGHVYGVAEPASPSTP